MRKVTSAITLFLGIILFTPAIAQESSYLSDYAGRTNYKYDKFPEGYDYAQKYTSQEEDVFKQQMKVISTYLQTYPLLADVKGVEIFLTSLISSKEPLMGWNSEFYSELNFSIFPWYMDNGKPTYKCIECEAGFSLYFNRLDMIFHGYSMEEVYDNDGVIMNLEPVLIGEQDGCKIYENRIVVISNGKPLWVPVTVKEYNDAVISKHQKLMKEGAEDAMTVNFFINKVQEEMASYSQEELNSPAYQGDKMGACPYKLEGARAIVKLNKDYFDRSNPRTNIQLVIVESSCIGLTESNEYYFKNEYSSPQQVRLTEILKSLRFSEFRHFLNRF